MRNEQPVPVPPAESSVIDGTAPVVVADDVDALADVDDTDAPVVPVAVPVLVVDDADAAVIVVVSSSPPLHATAAAKTSPHAGLQLGVCLRIVALLSLIAGREHVDVLQPNTGVRATGSTSVP